MLPSYNDKKNQQLNTSDRLYYKMHNHLTHLGNSVCQQLQLQIGGDFIVPWILCISTIVEIKEFFFLEL